MQATTGTTEPVDVRGRAGPTDPAASTGAPGSVGWVAAVEAVRAMAPAIAGRCDEIERGRRVPADVVDELVAAGLFRLLVPRSHGGDEIDLAGHARVLEELARVDGSVGWVVMIGSAAPAVLGFLPRASFDALYAEGPDVVVGGTVSPNGTATPVEGGFRVTGRWPFASGCQHAHWLLAHARVDDGRMPPVRMMVLPPGEVEIEDTWWVAGLCGTGSHHFRVDDRFVPTERSFVMGAEPCIDAPLLRIPPRSFASLECAAVAIGIAQGALDDVTALASGKLPAFESAPLAANPLFQHHLGHADASLRAARAALAAEATAVWSAAFGGAEATALQRAHARATATWVARTAASVVDTAYTSGGGSALYVDNPLQRRLRDIHALTQHVGVKADTLTKAGAVLAGGDVDPFL